jgi:hypothetical protein
MKFFHRVANKYPIVFFAIFFSFRSQAVEVDGQLNDAIWRDILSESTNYEVSPRTLNKINNNFSYKITTAKTGVYVALIANTPKHLRLRTQENDTEFSNDHFQILLDMNNKAQDAYVFSINHQGNYFDGMLNVDKDLDLDWNASWEYAVSADDKSWSAEVFIPWSAMSFSIKEKNQFGIYISRFDESRNSTYASSAVTSSMNSFYQQFTSYTAIIDSPAKWDFFPYVSWNKDIEVGKNISSIGTEIFWQSGDGQKLSTTINPDFGQIESDELVVNFSAIETFSTEKRPFFNDNQSLFDVEGPEDLTIVHTPRIGGNSYYDKRYNNELDSAIKYTINQPNFDVGLIAAFESSTIENKGRDFFVLRGQYSLGVNKLGALLNRVDTPSINRESTVASSDIHYVVSEDTSLSFGIIRTASQVNDVWLRDTGWWMTGSSDITEQHSHEFTLFSYGDNLELNDIGYVKRINRKQFQYEYQYKIPNVFIESIRDITFSIDSEFKTNFQDEKLPTEIKGSIEVVTNTEFEYEFEFKFVSSGFDDLTTRGNNSIWLSSSQQIDFILASPEYFWGKYDLEIEVGKEGWSGQFYNIEASIVYQLSKHINLGIVISQYNSDSWIDWDEENVINEYNFTEQGVEFSLNYKIDDAQELRLKFETLIGKANGIGNYLVQSNGSVKYQTKTDDFAFSESAFQLRYKYALSKLTAFYLSYAFAGDYEDEYAEFSKRNLYTKAIKSKDHHSLFAKIRLHF